MAGSPRQERKRPVKATLRCPVLTLQSEVPLSRHEGLIPGVTEQFRQRRPFQIQPIVPLAFGQPRKFFNHARTAIARHHHHARWLTPGGRVKIRKSNTCVGKRIQVGRRNLATEGANVRVAHVIGDD